MLALLAIGHVVVELEIAVELRLDVDGAEGELVNLGTTAERRGLILVRPADTTNPLSKSPFAEATTRGGWLRSPAVPYKVLVLEEGSTVRKVVKRKPRLLHIGTLVVLVGRARERRSVAELEKLLEDVSELKGEGRRRTVATALEASARRESEYCIVTNSVYIEANVNSDEMNRRCWFCCDV